MSKQAVYLSNIILSEHFSKKEKKCKIEFQFFLPIL